MKRKVFCFAIVLCAFFGVLGFSAIAQESAPLASNVQVPLTYADVDAFTAPEIGALPDMYVENVHFGYEVTEILWMYKTDSYFSEWNPEKPFEAGKTYRVGILLTTGDSYYYDEINHITAQINGENVDYKVIDSRNLLLMKDFTMDSYVKSINVSGLKTPVAGELPDTEVECASDSYTATVEWVNRTLDVPHDNNQPFKANTSYTARVIITLKDGYVFDITGGELYFCVNGVTRPGVVAAQKKTVSAPVYYEVDYAPLQDVKVLLDKPMPGATPDFDAECSGDGFVQNYNEEGYIRGVRWIDRVTGMRLTEEDTFVADREYIVNVMVEAGEDYKFATGRKYVYVNDMMCSEILSSDTRVRGFETYFRSPKEIASVNVTDLLKPAEGNTPDYWLNTDVSGVTVEAVQWAIYEQGADGSWALREMDENETFVDGNTYLVNVYLKNTNAGSVFAAKWNDSGDRLIATSASIAGERVPLELWRERDAYNVAETKDPYNYAYCYCWFDCESEKVTSATAWIDTPIAGETPDYTVSLAGDELLVYSVSWMKYTEDLSGAGELVKIDSSTAFEKGTTYCVFITVQAKGNRKVPYNATNDSCHMTAIVNGKYVDVYAVNKLDEVTVADPYKYAKLACWFKCNSEVIDTVDISGITAPVAGEKPSYDRNVLGEGYNAVGSSKDWDGRQDVYRTKNGVAWYDVTDGAMDYVYENQAFIGGRTYEVWIYLQTTGSNFFAVDGDYATTVVGTVNGYDATVAATVGSTQNYLLMRYSFTCEKVVLNEVYVEIASPVIGETPDWTKIDTDYCYSNSVMDGADTAMLNGISWGIYGENAMFAPNGAYTFEENTEYRVFIYMSLKEGYIIEDADSFEVYLNGMRAFNSMIFVMEPATILVDFTFPITDCTCSIVPVAEESATCTMDGVRAHYACEKCGLTFKDAAGNELFDKGEDWGLILATGHRFENWTAHEEYSNCHVGVCANCGEIEEADCEFVAVFVEGPSKYSKYNGTLFACELCTNEGAFYVDETSCEHILGEWVANERTGGTHYRTCECGKAYEETDCDFAITVKKAPSEYSDIRDVYLYTCKKCGNEHYEPIEGEIVTEENVTDEETNVTVSVPEGSDTLLPEGTTVSANPIQPSNIPEGAKDMMEESLGGNVDVIGGYDIILSYKDVEIQPYASICVTIPMGEDMDESDDFVIAHYDDYSITAVESVVFDWGSGTITFETDHFSKYLIIKLTPKDPDSHECNPTLVPEKAADCTTAGKLSYYRCECGKYYEDAEGDIEIENIETFGIIEALGHKDADANGKCDVCGFGESVNSNLQAFKDAVANLSPAASAEQKYAELSAALALYAKLTDAEKAEAAASFASLQQAITAYNEKAQSANRSLADASELALAPIAASFGFLALLWFALKKKFMM